MFERTQTSEGGTSLRARFFLSITTVTATDIAPTHIPCNMALALHRKPSEFEDTSTREFTCTRVT